jgi:predicted deacetylase
VRHLVVSLHDFHPGSRERIERQVQLLAAAGVPNVSLLVVPQWHFGRPTAKDQASLEFLRARHAAGDDLVLHGYYHMRRGGGWNSLFWTRIYTNNECEFLDLSDGEAAHRIERGRQLWDEEGWPLHGFIAPAWLMPRSQNALLRRLGFLYTTRLREVEILPKHRVTVSQSLCYSTRAAWRRTCSHLWNPVLYRWLRENDLLRLSLHPDDLEFPELRRQILEIVEMALADGCRPITYAGYAQM